MREWRSQSHVRWYCRYHVVIVPKYRRKTIYPMLRKEIGNILKEICSHYDVELIEGHALSDHVHMCLAIPPKHSVANIVGKLKGKSTMIIHQRYGRQRNFAGQHFWSRGYCVSTVGLDEELIKKYIRDQEEGEKREEQLALALK